MRLFAGLAELNTGGGSIYQEGEGCFVMVATDKDLSKHPQGFRYEGIEIREVNYTLIKSPHVNSVYVEK